MYSCMCMCVNMFPKTSQMCIYRTSRKSLGGHSFLVPKKLHCWIWSQQYHYISKIPKQSMVFSMELVNFFQEERHIKFVSKLVPQLIRPGTWFNYSDSNLKWGRAFKISNASAYFINIWRGLGLLISKSFFINSIDKSLCNHIILFIQ